MRFRPRHYALIAVILALGIYNIVRKHHQAPQAAAPQIVSRGTSPAWTVFDNAAKLRDASGEQFEPALKAVADAINAQASANNPQTSAAETTDLRGCNTWLLFYRQEHLRALHARRLGRPDEAPRRLLRHQSPGHRAVTDGDLLHALRDCYDPILKRNVVDLGLIRSATLHEDRNAPGATIPGAPTRYTAQITLTSSSADDTAIAQLRAQIENRLAGLPEISRTTITLLPPVFAILQ